VRGQLEASWVRLDVWDTGVGIPLGKMNSLFEPFVTNDLAKGGGMGLPILHSLVTGSLNGRVKVKSQPGYGTMVSMWLPRSMPHPKPQYKFIYNQKLIKS
jgi:two-component system cell cycle sensor histidine kinase/response regulator CckA